MLNEIGPQKPLGDGKLVFDECCRGGQQLRVADRCLDVMRVGGFRFLAVSCHGNWSPNSRQALGCCGASLVACFNAAMAPVVSPNAPKTTPSSQ